MIIAVGLFLPTIEVNAQTAATLGTCNYTYRAGHSNSNQNGTAIETEAACRARSGTTTPVSWTTCIYNVGRSNTPNTAPGDTETQCRARAGGTGTWISISLAGADSSTGGGGIAPVNSTYKLLAPLPCDPASTPVNAGCDPTTKTLKTFDAATGLGSYLNLMIKIFIGICAVLSVVMIVTGGIEYMTSELAHTKEAGKERIEHALLGLVIALGAYALLYTINPDLLKSDFNPPNATVIPPAVQHDVNFQGTGGSFDDGNSNNGGGDF